ncbi:hypothetical protein ACPPVS_02460 [Cellulomonas sp. McL0617]|uniref:hypothetical protein n=1 Tax=Cellulomonas sp. McL0617 TaxID=3415675 RepID=UPI003CEA8902
MPATVSDAATPAGSAPGEPANDRRTGVADAPDPLVALDPLVVAPSDEDEPAGDETDPAGEELLLDELLPDGAPVGPALDEPAVDEPVEDDVVVDEGADDDPAPDEPVGLEALPADDPDTWRPIGVLDSTVLFGPVGLAGATRAVPDDAVGADMGAAWADEDPVAADDDAAAGREAEPVNADRVAAAAADAAAAAESAATAATAADVGATERRTRRVGSDRVLFGRNSGRASVRRTALANGRCAGAGMGSSPLPPRDAPPKCRRVAAGDGDVPATDPDDRPPSESSPGPAPVTAEPGVESAPAEPEATAPAPAAVAVARSVWVTPAEVLDGPSVVDRRTTDAAVAASAGPVGPAAPDGDGPVAGDVACVAGAGLEPTDGTPAVLGVGPVGPAGRADVAAAAEGDAAVGDDARVDDAGVDDAAACDEIAGAEDGGDGNGERRIGIAEDTAAGEGADVVGTGTWAAAEAGAGREAGAEGRGVAARADAGAAAARRASAVAVARARRRSSRPDGAGAFADAEPGETGPAGSAEAEGVRSPVDDARPDPPSFPGRAGGSAARVVRCTVRTTRESGMRPAARTSSDGRTLMVCGFRREGVPPGR